VEWIFEKNGTRLVVLGTDVSAESSETGELAEDLPSIVMVFVARHNGMRSATNRRRRREAAKAQEEKEWQDSTRQGMTYPSISYARREIETQALDGNSMMDLQSVSRSSQKRGYRVDKKKLCELSVSTPQTSIIPNLSGPSLLLTIFETK